MKRIMRLYIALTMAALPIGTCAYFEAQISGIIDHEQNMLEICTHEVARGSQTLRGCEDYELQQGDHRRIEALQGGLLLTTLGLACLWFFGTILTYTSRWIMRGK